MTTPPYKFIDVGGDTFAVREDGSEVCDFCLAPDPRWEFPATDMPIKGHPVMTDSYGSWGACDLCCKLIVASDIGRLVESSLSRQLIHEPEDRAAGVVYPPLSIRRRQQRENILRFMDARTGPPTRYDRST